MPVLEGLTPHVWLLGGFYSLLMAVVYASPPSFLETTAPERVLLLILLIWLLVLLAKKTEDDRVEIGTERVNGVKIDAAEDGVEVGGEDAQEEEDITDDRVEEDGDGDISIDVVEDVSSYSELHPSPGDQVLSIGLTRDEILRHLNPWKLSDLQTVLGLRCFPGLLSNVDLKECYFMHAWGFREDEFVLANWTEMSVEEMRQKVMEAHPFIDGRPIFPPCRVNKKLYLLRNKEDIVRAYPELTYVPWKVYRNAVTGVHVLRVAKAGGLKGDRPMLARQYLQWAHSAGLGASVICSFARKCTNRDIKDEVMRAAESGDIDMIDLLASTCRARIDADCLICAAYAHEDAMIDHLVEKYELDPNARGRLDGKNALHIAAECGYVSTVKLLIEKHDVDINARDRRGMTALDLAEEEEDPLRLPRPIRFFPLEVAECASVLRGHGATNGEPVEWETASDEDVEEVEEEEEEVEPEVYGTNILSDYGYGEELMKACRLRGGTQSIRGLARLCRETDIVEAALIAVECGYIDAVDLLASEFGADIDVVSFTWAAAYGQDEMIDHLVETYRVDPERGVAESGWTALHYAAGYGRVRTVKHLLESHNVDIHAKDNDGRTALDLAEEYGMPECAAVLRGYGATNGEPDEWETASEGDGDGEMDSDHGDTVIL